MCFLKTNMVHLKNHSEMKRKLIFQTSMALGSMLVFGGANDSCICAHLSPIGAPLGGPDTLMHRLAGAGSDGCYTQLLIQQLPPPRCQLQLLMEETLHQLRLVAYPIYLQGFIINTSRVVVLDFFHQQYK